jgi:hypothetical protein
MKIQPFSSVPETSHEFGLMMLSAIRYILTRKSYIVPIGAELLAAHWNHPQVIAMHGNIYRDIKEHLQDEVNHLHWIKVQEKKLSGELGENEYPDKDLDTLCAELESDMDVRMWVNTYNHLLHYDKLIQEPLTLRDILEHDIYYKATSEDYLSRCKRHLEANRKSSLEANIKKLEQQLKSMRKELKSHKQEQSKKSCKTCTWYFEDSSDPINPGKSACSLGQNPTAVPCGHWSSDN